MTILESDREIDYSEDAGSIVVQTPVEIKQAVKPGISNRELDKIAEKYKKSSGTVSAVKGYSELHHMVCTSFQNKIVTMLHSFKKLKNGYNVSIDIGAGMAWSLVGLGKAKLPVTTEQGLFSGSEIAIEANRLGDSSKANQTQGESCGYGIVRDYVGHGIGIKMHRDPQIPNFGSAGRDPRLQSGMILLGEPRINLRLKRVKTVRWRLERNARGKLQCL